MKVGRRALLVAGVTTAAALVAAAVIVGHDGGDTTVAASAPPPTSTSPPSTSTTTGPPPPTTNAPAPSTTAPSSAPTPRVTTTWTTPLPRTMEWRAEEGSLTVHVTVEPAYPRAGEVARFRVEATDTEGGVIVFGFNPGDQRHGSSAGVPIVDCSPRDPDAPRGERSPAQRTSDIDHAYRISAQRNFSVTVATGGCDRKPHRAKVSGTITVLPGIPPSNGPGLPEVFVGENLEGAPPSGVWMSIGASDRDGVIRHISIDWGDGSAPSVLEVEPGEYSCIDEPIAFPSSGVTHGVEHVYAAAGTYTVTATVESRGCDGTAAQSVTGTGTATVAGQSE